MVVRAFRFSLLLSLAVLSLSRAWARVDRPAVSNLVGVAYHEGGWFSCGTDANKEKGYLQFDNNSDFILAPRYAGPVRKIILNVKCSSTPPKREMLVKPFVNGVETDDPALVCSVTSTVVSTEFACISFDFDASAGIDSFRLVIQGSSGNLGIADLIVFHGEKTEDEEKVLREFAHQLPAPTGLRIEDFTVDSLRLGADTVEDANGYCFEVNRLEGVPRTEVVEHFSSSTDLSDGWTFGETNNVKLSRYTSESMTDTKTSDGVRSSLSIAKAKEDQPVKVEVLSPAVEEPIVECSFFCKYSSSGSGETEERIGVYGRKRGETAWSSLGVDFTVTGSGQWQTNAIPVSEEIVQVKFVFEADVGKCRNCSLDTLRIVYGGNETRTLVSDGETNEVPECKLAGLETARYGYRVKAIGNVEFRDSSWSEEGIIDLAWANIVVEAPENVNCHVVGGNIEVTWDAVTGAECYIVQVVSADGDSPNPVRVDAPRTSVTIPISTLGDHSVVVEARSPAGKSVRAAEAVAVSVGLSKPTNLKVEVPDVETIDMKWDAVPLAESYRVKVYELVGDVETVESDYSSLPDAWPEGWTYEESFTGSDYFWTSGGLSLPYFKYREAWFATSYQDKPVTALTLSFASGSSAVTERQTLYVGVTSSQKGDDDWENRFEIHPPSTSATQTNLTFEAGWNVRRIRFFANTAAKNVDPAIKFGKFTMTLGAMERREVKSIRTEKTNVSVGGLSATGRYVVTLTPLPGEGDGLTVESGIVDIATMKPREAVPYLIGDAEKKGPAEREYAEDFSVLSGLTKATSAKEVDLPNWQFFKGDDETETLLFAANEKATTGGVYAILDDEKSGESAALGTLATSLAGAAIGIALSNDCPFAAANFSLTFDSIQRTFKTAGKSYVFEYMVTGGETRIDTEGEWVQVEIDVTAPLTAEDAIEKGTDCKRIAGFPIDLDVTVEPGQVLLLRWRDLKRDSKNGGASPLMGIDNVRLGFQMMGQKGFGIMLR